jgi:alginate O-acetyltransferase complex protein AlgI
LIVTMLVSGIWHGAGLNFLVWGAWHGTLLVLHRIYVSFRGPAPLNRPAWRNAACCAGTFLFVNLGWAFFCMDLPTAMLFFSRLIKG